MKLTQKDVTREVKTAVNAYLLARTYAEFMRDKVNAIQRKVLADFPMYVSDEWSEDRHAPAERITDPKLTYLADKSTWQPYFDECNRRERAAGIKPADMPDDNCPAGTAEYEQTKAEWLLLDAAARMLKMGIDGEELNHRLCCNGIEKRRQFIDLLVKLVVNLPDFRNPLTGKAA